MLLQLLVGVVDAQLLQFVDMERLKAVHVQDSCTFQDKACQTLQAWMERKPQNHFGAFTDETAPRGFVSTYAAVDERHQPFKQPGGKRTRARA